MKVEKSAVKVLEEVHVTKIVSGSDHLAMLSSDGQLWTMGNSEQGQLGRVNEKFAHRGGRRGLTALLQPDQVRLNFRSKLGVFTDVWAGSYNTVARTEGGQVVVMGLNNYSQMALPVSKGLSFFMPQQSKNLTALSWKQVAIGDFCRASDQCDLRPDLSTLQVSTTPSVWRTRAGSSHWAGASTAGWVWGRGRGALQQRPWCPPPSPALTTVWRWPAVLQSATPSPRRGSATPGGWEPTASSELGTR